MKLLKDWSPWIFVSIHLDNEHDFRWVPFKPIRRVPPSVMLKLLGYLKSLPKEYLGPKFPAKSHCYSVKISVKIWTASFWRNLKPIFTSWTTSVSSALWLKLKEFCNVSSRYEGTDLFLFLMQVKDVLSAYLVFTAKIHNQNSLPKLTIYH